MGTAETAAVTKKVERDYVTPALFVTAFVFACTAVGWFWVEVAAPPIRDAIHG